MIKNGGGKVLALNVRFFNPSHTMMCFWKHGWSIRSGRGLFPESSYYTCVTAATSIRRQGSWTEGEWPFWKCVGGYCPGYTATTKTRISKEHLTFLKTSLQKEWSSLQVWRDQNSLAISCPDGVSGLVVSWQVGKAYGKSGLGKVWL